MVLVLVVWWFFLNKEYIYISYTSDLSVILTSAFDLGF